MWLINTNSFALEFVFNPEDHPYAILSHTWGEDEVTFQDIADLDRAKTKAGFKKIKKTCELAQARHLKYAWVDTCCIDKSSSAELTEAINSMFHWYKKATICFVYLYDFVSPIAMLDRLTYLDVTTDLYGCRWFTRGWTLQELVASPRIEFYDRDWLMAGDKGSLLYPLSAITRVDFEVLENSDKLHEVLIARRMSWAAHRKTTRVEDMAYCLFGIFDVNLPLIYGEGPKAFIRLQEAIARESADLSLFAWDSLESHGTFAKSPADFESGYKMHRILNPAFTSVEYNLTNKGLHINTMIYEKYPEYDSVFQENILMLNCRKSDTTENSILGLRLAQTPHGYVRLGLTQVSAASWSSLRPPCVKSIYIPKALSSTQFSAIEHQLGRRIRVIILSGSERSFSLCSGYNKPIPTHLWDSCDGTFITSGNPHFIGIMEMSIDMHGLIASKYEGWHYPMMKIVLLLNDNRMPWAGIFSNQPEEGEFNPFKNRGSLSEPYVLEQIRDELWTLREAGKPIPTSLTLLPRYIDDEPRKQLERPDVENLSLRIALEVKNAPDGRVAPYVIFLKAEKVYGNLDENETEAGP